MPHAGRVARLLAAVLVASWMVFARPVTAVPAPVAAGGGIVPQERERGPERRSPEQLEALAASVQAAEKTASPILQPNTLPPMFWQALSNGPVENDFWSGGGESAGRVSSIVVSPFDANTVFLAAAQGGVWKSFDGGASWISTSQGLTSLATGALALDVNNPSIVYLGTGEQHYSGDSFYGDGLFRSVDQGYNWTQIASSGLVGSYIARVATVPADSNLIYVASDKGVVRSTTHGATWFTVLPSTGGHWCNDLVVDYLNPGTVYAALYGTGIYKSTNGGTNWTLLSGGLPTSGFDRINLTIGFNFPPRLYASFVDHTTGGLEGMYRSDDGGGLWTQLGTTPNYMGSAGWYASALTVLQSNSDVVTAAGAFPYAPGINGIVQSTDGGATWTDITFGASTQVHPDQHLLTYDGFGTLWVACDGGVWKRPAGAPDWTNCNANLSLQQFYSVDHAANDYYAAGGTQDLGSVAISSDPGYSYLQIIGGDGGQLAFATGTSDFLSSYTFLNPMYHWIYGSATTLPVYVGLATGPWVGAGDRASFTQSPLIADDYEWSYAYATGWFAGTQRVWKTSDNGTNWRPVSGDLTGGGVLRSISQAFAGPFGPAYALCTSSSDGRVFVSFDTTTWQDRSTGLPAGVALPQVTFGGTAEFAYVIADRATGSRVFMAPMSSQYFNTWTSITGDLPPGRRPLSLARDDGYTNRMYLGTDRGLYITVDNGTHWNKVSGTLGSLPDIAIYGLSVMNGSNGPPGSNVVIAATHGRGLWATNPDITGPSLTITSPAGGEQWQHLSTHDITWNAYDPSGVDSLRIYLESTSPPYNALIATGVPNTGTYSWTLPDVALPNCHVRLIPSDGWGNLTNMASADFAITVPTGVGDESGLPRTFALEPVRPNPSRAPIGLAFQMPRAAKVSLGIYDLAGRQVRMLASGPQGAGVHQLAWDGTSQSGTRLGAGIFFARFETEGFSAVRRFALLR